MASLIAWLADSGARKSDGSAVSSGYAYFYQPGTTDTQVTVFSDADGLAALTQPARLDAGGRATVYATAAVQVLIQDSTRATVRLHDRGNTVSAAQVEIQNTAATGTSLTTGAQVAGGLTDLNTFLSSLRASFGAPDARVSLGGAPTDLSDAVAPLAQIFDLSAYGAAGDDSRDDGAAIQQAINDAYASGGGIVLFPPGTYKLTSSLTTYNTVLLLGVSSAVCTVKQYSTSGAYALYSTTGALALGLTFRTEGNGAGGTLKLDVAENVSSTFIACRFTAGASATPSVTTSGLVTMTGCEFVNQPVTSGVSTSQRDCLAINGGIFRIDTGFSTAQVSALAAASASLCGVSIVLTAASSLYSAVSSTTTGTISVNGCMLLSAGGALRLTSGATVKVKESGCTFGSNTSQNANLAVCQHRDYSYLRTSTAATSYQPANGQYKFHEVVSSGATFQFDNPSDGPPSGAVVELVLRYKNTSAGAITPTFGLGYKASSVLIAANSAAGWHFVYDATLAVWVQIGAPVAYAS